MNTINLSPKIFRTLTLVMVFFVTVCALTFTASSAFAVQGPGGSIDIIDETRTDNNNNWNPNTPPAAGTTPTPGPATPPTPQNPGGADTESWKTHWERDVRCGTSPYGDAIGVKIQWATQYSRYDPGSGGTWPWVPVNSLSGEPLYKRTAPTGNFQCIYPPSFAYVIAECIISTNAIIREVRPGNMVYDSKTIYSGYTIGNTSRQACADSKTKVYLKADISRYSIVEAHAVSSAARVTFKVYTSVHPQTGVVPATEVVGTVGPYNLTPKMRSISISCKGVSKPADYSLTDFTDNLCNPTTWNPSYQCNANPVLFDTSPAGSTSPTMNSFPGDSVQFVKQQTANNGKQVTFSQNPTGSGITVNSYKTRFERSKDSTPWDSSLSASKNLVELDAVNPGGSVSENIIKNGTSSGWLSSRVNDTKFIAYGASDNGRPTKISQVLEWSGTRVVNSAQITGINPMTGEIDTVTTTINVPTSGMCTQTASIDMVRTIGDTVK